MLQNIRTQQNLTAIDTIHHQIQTIQPGMTGQVVKNDFGSIVDGNSPDNFKSIGLIKV
jgi:hypothetical protein